MTVNGIHGWPNGWHRGELHELDCVGPLCRCERVLRVVETVEQAFEAADASSAAPVALRGSGE